MPPWTTLPFSTTSLLGLDQLGVDALVLDGMVLQLGDRRSRAGETQVLVNRLPKVVYSCMPLKELLSQIVVRHHRGVDRWLERDQTNLYVVDRDLHAVTPHTDEAIGQFVRERLIPRLRAARQKSAQTCPRPPAEEPLDDAFDAGIQALLSMQIWPRWFAFYRNTWYGLAPFCGQPLNGRLHLVWKNQAFIGMHRERWTLAMRRADQDLEEAVRCSFLRRGQQRMQSRIFYQDAAYAVLRTPRKHYFLCLHLHPYAVEGPDRVLYQFPRVQVGVPITALEVAKVLHPTAARVMHAYRHMFAYSTGPSAPICMPQAPEYYPRVHRLPLEEALLQHLEAARMTLCAGYHEGNQSAPLHDIRRLNLPPISLREAQERELPVYRFFRKVKEVR